MILYPAIDLQAGKCVRLVRGQADTATIYNESPAAQAADFAESGCSWLHVVDLDGAFEGSARNARSVADILAEISVPVQLGGGIRDIAAVERWLGEGVARVVLGTAAVEKPDLVRDAARSFPGQVAIGIDARKGYAATRGWISDSRVPAVELARRFEDCGVCAVIYTDIDRDGVKAGPNTAATGALAESVSIPVISSGGISSESDLRNLRNSCGKLQGAIVGRALYDGSLKVADALAALNGGGEAR